MNMAGQFNDRLLTVVFWSLGVVGTVAITFVGFNWFINARSYERDKLALSVQLLGEIKTEISNVQKKLESDLAENLSRNHKIISGDLASDIKGIHSRINDLENSHGEKWLDIQIEVFSLEAKYWEEKKVYRNAITYEIKRGLIGIEYKNEYAIESSLRRIEELLPKISGDSLAFDEPNILQIIGGAPPTMVTVCERIKRILTR